MTRKLNRKDIQKEESSEKPENAVGSSTTDLKGSGSISPTLTSDRPLEGRLNAEFSGIKLEVIAKPYNPIGIRVLSDGFILGEGMRYKTIRLLKNQEIVVTITSREKVVEKAIEKPLADKMVKSASETK